MSGDEHSPHKALLLKILNNKYPRHLFGLNYVHLRFVYQTISYIHGILTAYQCAVACHVTVVSADLDTKINNCGKCGNVVRDIFININ